MRPETSLNGGAPLGGTARTPKSDGLIGCLHAQIGWPLSGPISSVTEATSGKRAIAGDGCRVYTRASNPWAATKSGNADAVRWPAAAAANTIPPTMLTRSTTASQDLQRRRSSARKTILRVPTTPRLAQLGASSKGGNQQKALVLAPGLTRTLSATMPLPNGAQGPTSAHSHVAVRLEQRS